MNIKAFIFLQCSALSSVDTSIVSFIATQGNLIVTLANENTVASLRKEIHIFGESINGNAISNIKYMICYILYMNLRKFLFIFREGLMNRF